MITATNRVEARLLDRLDVAVLPLPQKLTFWFRSPAALLEELERRQAACTTPFFGRA